MELNSTDTKVITTPHKERLEKVLNTIFPARSAQVNADVAPGKELDTFLFIFGLSFV